MDFPTEIITIFNEKLYFLFICGSYVYDKSTNNKDIDIFCCVDSLTKDEECAFREAYFSFHKQMGAQPDVYYPGELVTLSRLKKSIKLATAVDASLNITDKDEYDGLVWAGMIISNKIEISGSIPQWIYELASSCIKKWNLQLFKEESLSTKKLSKMVVYKNEFLFEAKTILDKVIKNKESLTNLLSEVESCETIEDEFFKTIDCLKNIEVEREFINSAKIESISIFFPINLPLYSSIIFGFVPSLMADHVFIRPPEVIAHIIKKIKNILFEYDESIYVSSASRREFIDNFVELSKALLFIGRYPNAQEIEGRFPDKLMIYTGAGINPIIINKNADITSACQKVIRSRVFNSGQDCAGPDAILVHEEVYDDFIKELETAVNKVLVGDYSDPNVRVGKLLKPDYMDELEGIFKKENGILYGGILDKEKKIVYPTIISKPLNEYKNYREFFSPIFWVSKFQKDTELKEYFETSEYKDYAMYVSIFGDEPTFRIPNSVTLKDTIVMEAERGNLPYGGFGGKAQFVSYKGVRKVRPMLISKELSEWCRRKL